MRAQGLQFLKTWGIKGPEAMAVSSLVAQISAPPNCSSVVLKWSEWHLRKVPVSILSDLMLGQFLPPPGVVCNSPYPLGVTSNCSCTTGVASNWSCTPGVASYSKCPQLVTGAKGFHLESVWSYTAATASSCRYPHPQLSNHSCKIRKPIWRGREGITVRLSKPDLLKQACSVPVACFMQSALHAPCPWVPHYQRACPSWIPFWSFFPKL